MIEVVTMAGTGKAAAPGAATHAGAKGPAAVDEGSFRESLKASVAAATTARTVSAVTPTGTRVVPMQGAVASAATASLPAAAAAPVALQAAVVKDSAALAEVPAAKVLEEDAVCPGAATGAAGVAVAAVTAVETLAVTKPSESPARITPGVSAKGLKDVNGAAGKKISGKGTEPQASSPDVGADGLNAAAGAGVAVVVPVALPAADLAVSVPAAGTGVGQTQAAAAAVNGNGKVGKAGSPNGVAKMMGRDTKKAEGQTSVTGKVEPPTAPPAGVGIVSAAPGSGAGHIAGKDGMAAPGALNVAGGIAVGAAASHVGLAGSAGSKVAANVDAVSTAGGQGTGVAGPEVKTLAATPNLLEVGIDGGTHGWLRVRAELGQTGEVTASVVASSAGQADTLRRELPAMSTYLAGESLGVSSLVVNAAGSATGAGDAAMNLGAGMQDGGADGRAQQGSLGGQSGEPISGPEGTAGLEFGGSELPAAVYANGSGSWLSVRV